jgi:NifU-like protein involved in Fe-S cluster formation
MPGAYNPRVIDHLVRPRHAGRLEDPSGTGESGDAACGDVAGFTVLVRENTVEDVRYEVFGCAACVAAGSALAELVSGRSLLDAARVSKADVEEALGGPLPRARATR